MIKEMIILFFIYFLFTISFNGWGCFTFYALGIKSKLNLISQNIFVGMSTVLLITQAAYLFLPIDWVISSSLIIIGIIFSCIFSFRENNKQFFAIVTQIKSYPYICLGIVILIVGYATRLMEPIGHGDAGLYHVPTISWLNQYSIVPGLGNLHFRLAFNQSYFHLAALLNIFPYWGHGYVSTNFLIFILTLFSAYQLINSLEKKTIIVSSLLALIFIGILQDPISTAADFTISLYEFNIFLIVFKIYISNINYLNNKEEYLKDIICLLVLTATCVTIKISSVVFCAVCVLIIFLNYLEFFKKNYVNLLRSLLFSLLIIFISMLTGYILSGYPIYPSAISAGSSPEWAIPLSSVKQEQDWIFSWARNPSSLPEDVLRNWSWVIPWMKTLSPKVWFPFGLGIIIFICQYLITFKNRLNTDHKLYALYVPLLAALTFWFFTAPDPRFIGAIPGLFLFLSCYIFSINVDIKKILTSTINKLIILICCVVFFILSLMYAFRLGTGYGVMQHLHLVSIITALSEVGVNQDLIKVLLPIVVLIFVSTQKWFRVKYKFLVKTVCFTISTIVVVMLLNYMNLKPSVGSAWAAEPKIDTSIRSTMHDLQLQIPVHNDRCWSAALLCTPYFNENLKYSEFEINGKYKFKYGFSVDVNK